VSIAATPPAELQASDTARERAARRALIAGIVVVLGGVGLMFVHFYGGTPDDPEGWFASVGFGAPIVAGGLLAVVGAGLDAPWQWWAAGIAIAPCALVSIVMIPLVIPAVVLLAAGFTEPSPVSRNVVGGVLAGALVASFAVIVFHQDPVTWSGGSSSNIVTTTEATLSVGVGVCVLAVAWAVGSTDKRRRAMR